MRTLQKDQTSEANQFESETLKTSSRHFGAAIVTKMDLSKDSANADNFTNLLPDILNESFATVEELRSLEQDRQDKEASSSSDHHTFTLPPLGDSAMTESSNLCQVGALWVFRH